MKVAITSTGDSLDSKVDVRFGRAKGFIIYDLDSNNYTYIENAQGLSLMKGAGIQTAQNVVSHGVQAIITGHIGPKAYQVLGAAGVDVFLVSEDSTVKQAIEDFKNNRLQKTLSADKPSHW